MAEKILIVDDDLETLRLVGLMLQRQGYQIVSARNGIEGINQAEAERPDLIVLDVMMPDLDGYQVAKRLRENNDTAVIPILMFTAKSQVDDKVTGYEAGADDYLTKPVHPAELIAHIKALLARTKNRTPSISQKRGYSIGLISPKGGLGVSTLTLNLALAYYNRTRSDVIAAEIRSGQGTWAGELGFNNTEGLTKLLAMKPADITAPEVENELIRTTFGLRLLLASDKFGQFSKLDEAVPQLEIILQQLASLCQTLFIDIGNPFMPGLEHVLNTCDELIVCTEPQPFSLKRTASLFDFLADFGYGKSKLVSLVILNRIRADLQFSANQIQEMLKKPISLVVPPSPELSYQSAMRSTPLILLQPDGIINSADQPPGRSICRSP